MARITTLPLFKGKSLSAGDTGTAGPYDLRYSANNGMFALSASVAAGTASTAGTTVFTYVGASVESGNYISPTNAAAIGTFGTSCTEDIITFEPELMAFIKIIATQTGSGNAGKDSLVTAELLMQ